MNTEKSTTLYSTAKTLMPGGVSSPVRAFRAVGGSPLFINRAQGSRVFDADGNAFIDYVSSWGPAILGHAHPDVIENVQNTLVHGLTFGAPSPLEIELATRVKKLIPSIDKVRFVLSGTEATMSAVRLARAATKRPGIVKMDGGYHGHADLFLVQAGSGATTFGNPDSAGVPESVVKDTYSIPYNDIKTLEKLFAEKGDSLAALIIEPVAGNMGLILPEEGYLAACREITRKHKALLIFDEVITGFRVAKGGAQARFGIEPDLTTLGKILGGGMPVGAYGGKESLMSLVAPEGPVYQAGTLAGNPLAMAAGISTLDLLQKDGVYESLEAKGKMLAEGLRRVAKEVGVPMQVSQIASIVGAFFSESSAKDYVSAKKSDTKRFSQFFQQMLTRGIYIAPSQFESWFVSLAHSEEDIKRTILMAKESLQAIKKDS